MGVAPGFLSDASHCCLKYVYDVALHLDVKEPRPLPPAPARSLLLLWNIYMWNASEAGEIKSNCGEQINIILPLLTWGPSATNVWGGGRMLLPCCQGFESLGAFVSCNECGLPVALLCLPGVVAFLLSINGWKYARFECIYEATFHHDPLLLPRPLAKYLLHKSFCWLCPLKIKNVVDLEPPLCPQMRSFPFVPVVWAVSKRIIHPVLCLSCSSSIIVNKALFPLQVSWFGQ